MSDNLEKLFTNEQNEPSVLTPQTAPIEPTKRSSPKQRKASMEEYQQAYLTTPKIVDRQTIFISERYEMKLI